MKRGFTLVEMLITVSVLAMVTAGIFRLNLGLERHRREEERRHDIATQSGTLGRVLARDVAGARLLEPTGEGLALESADGVRVEYTLAGSVLTRRGEDRTDRMADGLEAAEFRVEGRLVRLECLFATDDGVTIRRRRENFVAASRVEAGP